MMRFIELIQAAVDSKNQNELTLRNVRHKRGSDRRIVRGLVNGEEVWFESDSVPLRCEPFAYAVAYLISAMKKGSDIRIHAPVRAEELKGLGRVVELAQRWWGFSHHPVLKADQLTKSHEPLRPRIGQFFSCGVDSFHTLFTHRDEIDDLILIHGFDVPLEESERFEALHHHATAVAKTTGKRLITIRTNLRKNRLFGHAGWEQVHGAGLAAIGHLLSDEIGRLHISASHPSEALVPWGTHPLLDHLWSTDRLDIRHTGGALWRMDKVRAIVHEPLFQEHVVVCWEGKGLPSNCGHCEKCVRNRLAIAIAGKVEHSASFPDETQLAEAIESLPALKSISSVYVEYVSMPEADPKVKRAVQALLDRSHKPRGSLADSEVTGWNQDVVSSRIANSTKRKRYPGGSPNEEEILVYSEQLPDATTCAESTVVVLGMTPELREMAAQRFARVVSIDKSQSTVQTYLHWLPSELAGKEEVFAIDWAELGFIDWRAFPPVRAVMGDGIFGNLPDENAHRQMLRMLKQTFPEAIFVFRKALALFSGPNDETVLNDLRRQFRAGEIDANGFGFSVRLKGYLNQYYDSNNCLLDNKAIFEDCERRYGDGFFSDEEIEGIRRFRFGKSNCILRESEWERLISEEGFQYSKALLDGKPWYPFYPIYRMVAENG